MTPKMNCVKCGFELESGDTRCVACGSRQPAVSSEDARIETPVGIAVGPTPAAATPIDAGLRSAVEPPKSESKSSKWGVVGVAVVLALAGGAYWAWSQKSAADERIVQMEQEKVALDRQRAEEERQRKMKETEEKERREADEKAKSEQAQKLAEEERLKADAAEKNATGTDTVSNSSSTGLLEKVARCETRAACVSFMLASADPRKPELIQLAATRLSEMAQVQPGDRPAARGHNAKGLDDVRKGNFAGALESFLKAVKADPSDAEIRTNLGYVLLKLGRNEDALNVLSAAVQLDPRRGVTWHAIAELFAVTAKGDLAVKALMLTYEFSKAKDKALAYFEKQALSPDRPELRPVYELAILKLRNK